VARRHGYTGQPCRDCYGTGYLTKDSGTLTGWAECDSSGCLGTGSLWVRPGEPPLNDAQLLAKFSS